MIVIDIDQRTMQHEKRIQATIAAKNYEPKCRPMIHGEAKLDWISKTNQEHRKNAGSC
jgi:hypothetical protein